MRRVAATDTSLLEPLGDLLIDAVHSGASIGFLAPVSRETADRYWHGVFASLGGDRLLWVAEKEGVVVGTVQLSLCDKDNGRHRAEVQKLLGAACCARERHRDAPDGRAGSRGKAPRAFAAVPRHAARARTRRTSTATWGGPARVKYRTTRLRPTGSCFQPCSTSSNSGPEPAVPGLIRRQIAMHAGSSLELRVPPVAVASVAALCMWMLSRWTPGLEWGEHWRLGTAVLLLADRGPGCRRRGARIPPGTHDGESDDTASRILDGALRHLPPYTQPDVPRHAARAGRLGRMARQPGGLPPSCRPSCCTSIASRSNPRNASSRDSSRANSTPIAGPSAAGSE